MPGPRFATKRAIGDAGSSACSSSTSSSPALKPTMLAPSESSSGTSVNPRTLRKKGRLAARASTAMPICDTRVPRGVDGVIKFIDERGGGLPSLQRDNHQRPRTKLIDEDWRGVLRSGD